MSPFLEKILDDVDQLDPQEQLKVVSHLIESWQQKTNLFHTTKKFSHKNLFGCMHGQIAIAEDFDAP
jgi:hypothetical protein